MKSLLVFALSLAFGISAAAQSDDLRQIDVNPNAKEMPYLAGTAVGFWHESPGTMAAQHQIIDDLEHKHGVSRFILPVVSPSVGENCSMPGHPMICIHIFPAKAATPHPVWNPYGGMYNADYSVNVFFVLYPNNGSPVQILGSYSRPFTISSLVAFENDTAPNIERETKRATIAAVEKILDGGHWEPGATAAIANAFPGAGMAAPKKKK